MKLPDNVTYLLKRLENQGFSAYAVGGCVRDRLLGREPGDWDICTAAAPEETEGCFRDLRVIETGLKHGTVTVLYQGQPFEITTFRQDGDYVNHRAPEQVRFVRSLDQDLARRDFTVNAMAVGLDGVIVDRFGGQKDLEARCIRAVGDPDRRFQEDALRILRAMRFASQLDFQVEPETAAAMGRNRQLLRAVSGERIYKELTGLLVGPGAVRVLGEFSEILAVVLPECGPAMGFLQQNPFHNRDVWGHTLEALGYSRPEPRIRWALLLHDLGKPECFTVDDRGVGHFYGHPARSEALARQCFARLHVDRATTEAVAALVGQHDAGAPVERKVVRRWLGRFGPELLLDLLEVKRADCLAHVDTPKSRARYQAVLDFTALTQAVLAEERCFSVKDLEISGKDILALGVQPGPQVGRLLEALLTEVLEDRCGNDRAALTARCREMLERNDHAD
jgi:tRNA nucleotidyltransferase (CCA-adding enzyme)